MKPVYLASAVVFAVVALLHLWRLIAGAEVTIDGWIVPMWASYIGLILPGALAFLLWKEQS